VLRRHVGPRSGAREYPTSPTCRLRAGLVTRTTGPLDKGVRGFDFEYRGG
jgi:hypothetical protein